jgi:hypothetical protein
MVSSTIEKIFLPGRAPGYRQILFWLKTNSPQAGVWGGPLRAAAQQARAQAASG